MLLKRFNTVLRFCCGLLCVTALSACGGGDSSSPGATATAEPEQESNTRSVLDGGEIINQAQQQLDQFTADAENRLEGAMAELEEVDEDAR